MSALASSIEPANELTLIGGFGYRIKQDRIMISIDQIANQRSLDNLSGTLSIELHGYSSDGRETVLASTTIGQITGQHFLEHCVYDLVFNKPYAGIWTLALELKEWDGNQFALQSRQLFDQTYYVPQEPETPSPLPMSNVIVADFSPSEAKPDTVPPNKKDNDRLESPAITTKHPKQPKPTKSVKTKKKQKPVLTSINKSSLEELSSVKGMPKKLAIEIVDKRPHKTWESLLKLKGMGPKLLKKLSAGLKLN
ncbi:ComEA family DNA-binding protein [Marinomonas ostreistagni]|uniref:Helix-hairpin-helix domain-containing protein n=1 Tax=Marinomonas ostreistagni TaxID=359209 RepID=A0ABS0ZE38_9GAMM|nr:helix-hairpin-helix domain-containing protein [Marinomonas ostreistagni]MBJ7551196.1 helix-hairpin-helix domain-containing protein [Marinomonas ostreistagni]